MMKFPCIAGSPFWLRMRVKPKVVDDAIVTLQKLSYFLCFLLALYTTKTRKKEKTVESPLSSIQFPG